jgi:glycosyltransferase involved in cell wall biosynthesis
MAPLVSILIPAYNSQEWIADTIRSALAQTWQSKEIIVVDDGSKDQTLEVVRQFESESVRVYSQQNQGAAAARNKAFSLSKGDYIQWLDADDLLAPDKIANQMKVVDAGISPRTVLSSVWGHFIYRPYRAQFKPNPLWYDLSPAEFLRRKMEKRAFMQTAVWLVSREVTEAAGPWDISLTADDDGEYFCRVLVASDGIRCVPDARVYYRLVGNTSLSYVGRSRAKQDALWRSMQLHMSYLLALEESPRSRASCIQYLQNYLPDFYPTRPDIVEQLRKKAQELGGKLDAPRLSWKYSLIKTLFGWTNAKRAQLFFPQIKWSMEKTLDKVLFQFEKRKFAGH